VRFSNVILRSWEEGMKTIGLLISAKDTDQIWHPYIRAFKQALTTQPVRYDQQPAGAGGGAGGVDYDAAAQQLADDEVDVIVTAGNLAALACKSATKTIPIVVASAGDLTGLAGGNLTGFTNGQDDEDILNERIARMLRILTPQSAVAVVGNYTVAPVKTAMDYALRQDMGVPVYSAFFTQPSDFQDEATIQEKLNPPEGTPTADVLLVCSDPLMRTYGTIFVRAAHDVKMKTMHEFAEWHDSHGGDLCYGPDFTRLFQNAARYVDQILANSKIADLPVIPVTLDDCLQTPPPPP
jgi:putative tryptophan/tyrosine transport system substrate-binding protein